MKCKATIVGPHIIFYLVEKVKGPKLFPELEFDHSCSPGRSSSLPTIDPDLFSFVFPISKPSLRQSH